jgi:hypothetical protein
MKARMDNKSQRAFLYFTGIKLLIFNSQFSISSLLHHILYIRKID